MSRLVEERALYKINKETRANTKFYDITESTGILEKPLPNPTLPRLVEVTPKKVYSFQPQHLQRGGIGGTQLDNILQDFTHGTLLFVGHAGSGKTTLLKYIAQLVLDDELPSLNGIEMVLYVKCQDLNLETEVSEETLLFHSLSDTETQQAMKFISENQTKCLFLIDSFESCIDFTSLRSNEVSQNIRNENNPGIFLRDLISGSRFPKARVIATSRDAQPSKANSIFQAVRIVTLTGLSPDSIISIMKHYLGNKKGFEMWQDLAWKNPEIAALCSTPVFLVYAIMARVGQLKATSPTTISTVLIKVLECFLRSEHLTPEENIADLVSVLKRISYKGIKRGKFVFSKEDFEQENTTHKRSSGFTSQKWLLKKLVKGSESIHFNHTSLQESFAALFISEMGEKNFIEFARCQLLRLDPRPFHSSLVRRLVFGFLLDDGINKDSPPLLSNENNIKRNQKILLDLIRILLEARRHIDDIQFICALHEAKNGVADVIRSTLTSLKVERKPLMPNDCYAIGSVASKCKHLTELSLSGANVFPFHLKMLQSGLDGSSVQIDTFSLSNNPNLASDGLITAGKLASSFKMKQVRLDGSVRIARGIASLCNGIGDHKLEKLDLSWNRHTKRVADMIPDKEACQVVWYYKPSLESVRNLNVPEPHKKNILENLRRQEFQNVTNINGQWKKAPGDFFKLVIEILPKVTQKLKLYGWKFSRDEIEAMKKRLIEMKETGLKIVLGEDLVLSKPDLIASSSPNRCNTIDVFKVVHCSVECEQEQDSIKVSWDKVKRATCYSVTTFCDGREVSKKQTTTPTFTEKPISPSKAYEFLVQPLCDGEKIGSGYKSNVVMTDPEQPIALEAKEVDKGIYLSWRSSQHDTVEKYRVKTICSNDRRVPVKLYKKCSYLLENPIPGTKYHFEVTPYNIFERRGKAAFSNVVKFTGKLNGTGTDLRAVPNRMPDKRADMVCPRFCKIQTEEELINWCEHQRNSNQTVSFQEIQLAHEPLDESRILFLSRILHLSPIVGELELRDCNLKGIMLGRLIGLVKNSNCKVEEITIGAQKHIGELMSGSFQIAREFGAKTVNLAENDIQQDMIKLLLDISSKHQDDNSLDGLDVSFNKNIEDWEDVGTILSMRSLTTLKAMGCDLTMQNLEDLRRGSGDWKIGHFDVSYNSDLDAEFFKTLPLLLSKNVRLLALAECGLTKSDIKSFDRSANGEITVDTIDVSYNEDLEYDGMSAIGSLVRHCKTGKLVVAGCSLDAELIESLSDSLENHKLSEVDMSDNACIGDKIDCVAAFAKDKHVQNLDISDCALSAGQLNSFCEEMKDRQLSVLNVSDSIMMVDEQYMKAICKLIRCVKTEIIAIFPNMEEGCLEIMQTALNRADGEGPLVTYAKSTESTNLDNGIKFTVGTEKSTLKKKA